MSDEKVKSKQVASKQAIEDCFIIMPIADPENYEKGHFNKVYEDIIKVACKNAGFNPVRADEVKQTNLIHLDILQKLIDSPMAICDLSNRNPNVLFELGLRQAFDKPTVLIQECGTPKIFDISPLRYTEYRKELKYRDVIEDQDLIADAIKATKSATDKGEGINSIVGLLSLSSPASLKDVSENDTARMMQVIMSEMNDLRTDFRRTIRRIDERKVSEQANPFNYDNRYGTIATEIDEIKTYMKEFENAVNNKAPIEVSKLYYDRIQNRIARLIALAPPIRFRAILHDLQSSADLLITKSTQSND